MTAPLLSIENLRTYFHTDAGVALLSPSVFLERMKDE